MCGRYALIETVQRIGEQLRAEITAGADDLPGQRYNIPPGAEIPLMRQRGNRREIHAARWGLAPFRATNLNAGRRRNNARLETLTQSPLRSTAPPATTPAT